MEAVETDRKYGELLRSEIWDGNCGVPRCAFCRLQHPVAKIRVRGLCQVGSQFDKEYYYVIMENGKQAYLGRYSSLILYDDEQSIWSWTDAMDSNSQGII